MPHPAPLLINPKAGSLFRSGLKAWLDHHRDDFRIVPTKSAEDLTSKARTLAESGEPVVAAAGGDGTLMCAAQGLVGTQAALGILPCGTMNVFARELGIGSRRFDVALQAIKGDKRQAVDIFAVNGKPFLQMAGFGPDARVIELITPQLKKRMGAAAHVITGLKVATERPPLITMTLPDGETIKGTQIIMGNGKRYGGEAHLFADASYDDGHLDAAIIDQENMGVLFEILGLIVSRGATEKNISDFTELRRFKSCEITAEGKLPYHLDGDYTDTLMPGDTLRVERLPYKLNVCIPAEPVPVKVLDRMMMHPVIAALREKLQALNEL
ncbi:MAG: hypothetical protein IKA55_02585 [Akkermansia sp.]|nr:hypothetical protein [Akkermansia sp.]